MEGTEIPTQGITFSQADPLTEVMRVEPSGRFFVRGEEVETSEEIRDIFARWCEHWMDQNT